MFSWVIQITIISIILIFLVHHLINFFKSTLTVPKIKDLVNTPIQKYENMYNIIKKNSNTSINMENYINTNTSTNEEYTSTNEEYTLIDLLPKKEEPTMKNELKNFLKKQLHKSTTDNTISAIDSFSSIDSFSNINSFSDINSI
jgi:hypothetical protein